MEIRNNWTREEVEQIFNQPFLDLVYQAATVHRAYHDPNEVQISTLLSIKTGGCPEDCSYCSQAARYHTNVKVQKLLPYEEVIQAAVRAKDNGSSRFCMGAAWREVRDNKDFDRVLDMVKGVNSLGMEVCCTLGMLSEDQAQKLKDAGLYAYNHNIDTSEEYYDDVISTRTYDDRLETLGNVRKAKLSVCSGGIIGMGESAADRIGMLLTLANLPEHPGSVPVNNLVPVEGTPFENQQTASVWDLVRVIATARIMMPKSAVRLSAGRLELNYEGQAFCFMAGANSIFSGDVLLTTPNPDAKSDKELFQILNIKPKEAFKDEKKQGIEFNQIPSAQGLEHKH
ncbi:MAG: Biotin synthase [Bacteroidota bacterium]|jgi:biotin synthase